jgi:biopolymer transport protein ExbD
MFDRYRVVKKEVDVNLIPVMNLFVVLIPFLLLAAAFMHIGVIATSLPSQTDESSDIAADTKSVTVNMLVEKDSISISASNAVLDEATLATLSFTLPKGKDGFDLEILGKALHEIKLRYENSDTVIVLPGDDIEYQQIVEILDASREITFSPGTPEELKIPLFPVVVLSRKV